MYSPKKSLVNQERAEIHTELYKLGCGLLSVDQICRLK